MQTQDENAETRVAAITVAVVVGVLLLFVASTLGSVQYELTADEGYYAAYADVIAKGGISSLPALNREYLENPRHQTLPNPLRGLYLAAAGSWNALRGTGPAALSEISLASHAASVAIGTTFALRAFGPRVGGAAGLLLAFSPLLLGLSRRALTDAPAAALGMGALVAAYAWSRAPASGSRALLFSFLLAAALLVKESTALLAPACALVLGLPFARAPRLADGARFLAGLALAFALALVGWLLASGGPTTFAQVVPILIASPETNLYAQQFGGGPWTRYLIDFLLLSPVTTLIALCAIPSALVASPLPREREALRFLLVAVVGIWVAHEFVTKNVRYVAVLELPIRVFAAWAIVRASRLAPPRFQLSLAAAVVVLLCALDARSFYTIFVDDGLYDPITAQLMRVRGLLPAW
jgi:4-amino-4-deoxy-L-arabinose transferase-like glycosyltransferase